MIEIVFRVVLAGVLAGAALSKLASPASSRAALATFGFADGPLRDLAWAAADRGRAGPGGRRRARLRPGGAYGAAALMLLLAALMAGALLRGQAGAPCACFGARSRVSRLGGRSQPGCWPPPSPRSRASASIELSTDEWLGIGLGLALAACAGLAVAVLALAREVGMLRLQLGTQGALEIAGEGPALGTSGAGAAGDRIPLERARTALAVFTSEGCQLCQSLEPGDREPRQRARCRGRRLRRGRRGGAVGRARDPGEPVRRRARSRWDGARQGDLQQPRPARERAGDRGAAAGGGHRGGCRSRGFARPSTGSPRVPEHLDRLTESLARDTSRRGFLARVGGALVAATAARTVGTLIEPGDSDAFHFCGHIFTTGSCPHPTGLPRIDSRGYPLRASDGHPIDDAGRPVNEAGQPVGDDGQPLRDPDGRPLPPAPRTQRLRPGAEHLRDQDQGRWLLVPLLRRQGAQARRLLLAQQPADQRRRRPDRLLLRRPQGLLRHVLRHPGALLMEVGALEISLLRSRPADRRHRHLLALRALGDRDDRPHRPHRRAADHGGGLPDLPSRGDRGRGAHLRSRSPCSASCSTARAAAPPTSPPPRSPCSPPCSRCGGRGSCPRSAASCPSTGAGVMPMPLAAALYGVLLGIGFTTFVLSFGVWALAGISLALGDPELGLLLGAGFGLGRAIPIVALAPLAGRGPGIRANELMCERPGVYLGLRRGDAAALAAAALALVLVPVSAGATGGRRRARHRSVGDRGRPRLRAARRGRDPAPRRRSAPSRERPRDRRHLRRHDRRPRQRPAARPRLARPRERR